MSKSYDSEDHSRWQAQQAPGKRFGKSKLSGLLLVLFIVGLYLVQNNAVKPFVEKVVQSNVFDADISALEGKDRGRVALSQC